MTDTSIGQLVDQLGVTVNDLTDDVHITDVVVLAKCVRMTTGEVSLYTAHSAGMSWIEKLGMLTAARDIEAVGWRNPDDDDDG